MKCAEALNYYFHSQFCADERITDLPPLLVDDKSSEILPDGVRKLIHALKNNKSLGPDQNRKCDLLVDSNISSKCLFLIYQVSLSNCVLPYQWKTANVLQVHKDYRKENYRPISLTSIPCKILEHIVLHYLNETLDTIPYNRQHGFRSGLGCDTRLCATYHDIAKAVDRGSVIHGVTLDFQKTFDKVPHYLNMQKIRKIEGISHKITNWTRSFLTNKSPRVEVRGALSTELPVSSGVKAIFDLHKRLTRTVSRCSTPKSTLSRRNSSSR